MEHTYDFNMIFLGIFVYYLKDIDITLENSHVYSCSSLPSTQPQAAPLCNSGSASLCWNSV